jgi:putative aldouronate transport system permease protein
MAFQDYNPGKGFWASEFVGFKHFAYMLSLHESFRIFRNTIVIALGKIVAGILMAIIFSILLSEVKIGSFKKTAQTIVYLPHFLSWVVLAQVVVNMINLDGPVNHFLFTMGAEKVNFLGSNKWFQPMLIATDLWKEFGYNSIVYLAAITTIDPGLYEAASIDGASWLQKVLNITLPGMMPVILLMAALGFANVLNAGFDQVYNLYSPMVYETADILDTFVYRTGLLGRQYSFATAVGLLKSVVGIILMVSANTAADKLTGRRIF